MLKGATFRKVTILVARTPSTLAKSSHQTNNQKQVKGVNKVKDNLHLHYQGLV